MKNFIIFPDRKDFTDISVILGDIRRAKRVLQKAEDAYLKVQGEISRIDILCAFSIKEIHGGSFWYFIKNWWSQFNDQTFTQQVLAGINDKKNFFDTAEWKDLANQLGNDKLNRCCRNLVNSLLEDDRIQSAASDSKYREILVAIVDKGARVEIKLSDQKYLTSVAEWKESASKELIEGLVADKKWSESFEYFQARILDEWGNKYIPFRIHTVVQIENLTHEVNERALNVFGAAAEESKIPAFIPIWRTFTNSSWKNTNEWKSNGLQWCIQEGHQIMKVSFSLFVTFDYYWIHGDNSGFSDSEISQIRKLRWQQFETNFTDGRQLLNVFPDELSSFGRWTLYHFVEHAHSTSRRRKEPYGIEEWNILNPLFSEMLEIDPKKAALLLSPFFVKSEIDFGDNQWDESTGKYKTDVEPRTKWLFEAPSLEYKQQLLRKLIQNLPLDLKESDEICQAILKGANP